MKNRVIASHISVLIILILLLSMPSGCGRSDPDSAGGEDSGEVISHYLRASTVLVSDIPSEAEKTELKNNPFSGLDIPTQIMKVEDTWFIVDCYHDQIIYNDNLKDPLNEWRVMTGEINRGHTIASDGTVYLVDDTENDRILIFERAGEKFILTQRFDDITSRPHYIIYDEKTDTFYAWCSLSGEMYLFRHGEGDSRMYLTEIRSIEKLNGIYVRSFTIMGDEIYFVSGGGKIIRADLGTFKILSEYPVPGEMAGMVQITKIGDYFYITVSTDENWNQDYATIIRCRSLEGLADREYEDIYGSFIGGGTPYYITEADGSYYLTEHRIPGHSVWRFDVEGDRIAAETLY